MKGKFDAMVATELALAVAHLTPETLGGGGFMVYRKGNEKRNVRLSREGALAATKICFRC
jgi:gamma-glutamyltranspeptidase/glutathione hydrolase